MQIDDGNILIPNASAATIPTPAAGSVTVFAEGDKLKQKNSSGAVTDFSALQAGYARTKLAADQTNANVVANTLQDVTGLSFTVAAGATYKFRFYIVYTAAALTTGSRWTINTPAATALHYRSEYSLGAATRTTNDGLTASGLPAAANASSAATASNIAVIDGVITPAAAGTVIARFASEITLSAVVAKAGLSFVEWEQI